MSQQYNEYLQDHRKNVIKGYLWMRQNIPGIFADIDSDQVDIEHQITYAHDASKDSQEEYDAYDKYFYSNNKSYKVVEDFNYAWLHHIHNNPHHWQHWVLINDDPEEGMKILDMPVNYIIEMICDWWAFSWKSGDLYGIFDWYNEHKDYMKLSDDTRRAVEGLLFMMRGILEELDNENV